MTLKSSISFYTDQKLFSVKDSFDSFLIKLEVLADNSIIINSIRILIVMFAFLMCYIHTPKNKEGIPSVIKSGIIDEGIKPIMEKIN